MLKYVNEEEENGNERDMISQFEALQELFWLPLSVEADNIQYQLRFVSNVTYFNCCLPLQQLK